MVPLTDSMAFVWGDRSCVAAHFSIFYTFVEATVEWRYVEDPMMEGITGQGAEESLRHDAYVWQILFNIQRLSK